MRTTEMFRAPTAIQVSALAGVFLSVVASAGIATAAGPHHTSATMSTIATGLNNPRGLKFGPDGNLYVAEGGIGGLHTTDGECTQVIPPVGPYTGSQDGARISKIDMNGVRTTVVDGLPSSQTSPNQGSLVSGVADIAFIGDTMYALMGGAGCSHGVEDFPNSVLRINSDGTWTMVADLSAFQMSHPVQNPEEDDFEPDGTWYSMVAVRGDLYAVEPNHGELDRITPDGQITRVTDISASQGHIVPTAVAYHGNFYVGNLDTFPIQDGASKILKITPSGQVKVVVEGLTTVLGVAFDHWGRMYVLEDTTGGNPFPAPGAGQVVRVGEGGALEVVASGLSLPTGMTFGPDGNLYVSNVGFAPGFPPPTGLGEIVKITLGD